MSISSPSRSAASPSSDSAPGMSPAFSPLYQQIKALILQSLQIGEWKPGEAIPSEMDLAARYRVSQGTVRKAIDDLAAGNLVVRKQGKGTFVATHDAEGVQFRFLRLMPEQGEPHYPGSRVLECKRMRAPAEIARRLDLKPGDSVVRIGRVLFFSGEPTVLEEIWLPGASFKGLTAERLIAWRGPMYAFFETEFGVRMLRATERIRAVEADAATARLLSVAQGSPLLSVERVSRTFTDRPVELRYGLYVTARHYYQNELG